MEDASNAKFMLKVKFKSRLSDDEARRRYKERLPEFRKVPGLLQKFYLYDESTGEWAGLYLWDSAESLQKYLDSDLRKTIASAYEVEGAPQVEKLSVVEALRH
jgi:heme-degrading monooxygenase HmoA